MKEAFESNTWYCHAFCKIPKVQLMVTQNDDGSGELESNLFSQVENCNGGAQRTTHRQMVLDGKFKSNKGSKRQKDNDQDAIVDFTTSFDQVKCSQQLTTIFNILDHQKAVAKKRSEEQKDMQDIPEQPQDFDAENANNLELNQQEIQNQEHQIEFKTGMDDLSLQDEILKSGYKIYRMKEHIPSYVKPEAAEDDDNDLNEDQEHVDITNDNMTTRDAFFALMAIKMMKLSQKYHRKLEDLHDMFYTVSCDWQRLE